MECGDALGPLGGINESTFGASESMPCGSFRSPVHSDMELRDWMRVIHKAIQGIELTTSAQSEMIQDLQSSVKALSAEISQPKCPASVAVLAPHAPAEIPARLCQEPNTICLLPGTPWQINEEELMEVPSDRLSSVVEKQHESARKGSKVSRISKRSSRSSKGVQLPSNFQELEDSQASEQLGRCRPSRRSVLSLIPSPGRETRTSQTSQVRATVPEEKKRETLAVSSVSGPAGGEEKTTVLRSTGKMSMEQLRMEYDEAVSNRNNTKELSDIEVTCEKSSIPYLGRFFLCLVGHMQFGNNFSSRCFSLCSSVLLPVAMTVLLLSTNHLESMWNLTKLLTLGCFQLGISAASYSLKRKGLDQLLGPKAYKLDEYATDADFMDEWQRLSRRRLMEMLGTNVFVFAVATIASFASDDPLLPNLGALPSLSKVQAVAFEVAFWSMLLRYLMLCYYVLHISCCLELSLDSFTLSFFKDMDIEEALEEWNILQATLRHVSGKMGFSLGAMGFCCLACVALLAEQVIFNTDEALAQKIRWSVRFYPLVIAFLYTMVRAARVTEKASRVAPLVNSWKFDDDEEGRLSIDHGRQYAVQYMMQSRAGFYVSGAQLSFFDVQKICYYFGAVAFALTSRILV